MSVDPNPIEKHEMKTTNRVQMGRATLEPRPV
jgi:hypothetical protein